MNRKFAHLFSMLTMISLCASVRGAEHHGWGDGTPMRRVGTPSSMAHSDDWSGARAAASYTPSATIPTAASSPALTGGRETPSTSASRGNNWGSNPSLSVPQPSREDLLRENEILRRSLAQSPTIAPAAPHTEPFNPQAHPVLAIQWTNLLNGYPDPTKLNYDPKRSQYYDASTGIFPFRQPPNSSLKNILGPEVKAWEMRVSTARQAYMTAYQDWQYKVQRYARKTVEDAVKSADSLTDSLLPSGIVPSSAKETSQAHKREGILQQAKVDAENAERAFKKLQKLFLALHPAETKIVDEGRQLIFLTPDELEKRFIWGYVEKPFASPYKTLPGPRNDPNNVKGFLLTDPVDIRIGIHTLSWLVLHLEREYGIFMDIRTRYGKEFVPKVTGLFSSAIWSDWWNSTSANLFKAGLKNDYPSSSPARFQEPKTDQEETLRLLRRDPLGLKSRSQYLDEVKRYQDVEVSDLNEKFFKVYQGLDSTTETTVQTSYPNPKREFPNPLSTPFLSIQTRHKPATLENGDPLPDVVTPVVLPKSVQMASEYVSPKVMGFHRSLWPHIMGELKVVKDRAVLKPPSFGLGGAAEYDKLYSRYERIVKEISLYLKPLQTAHSTFLPAPFEFFFAPPLQPKPIAAETTATLEELGITDQDLTNRRVLSDGKSEPVLHRYNSISLAHNALQTPNPAAFGSGLVSLNVSKNGLTSLGFTVPLTGLTELDVSDQLLNDLSPYGNEGVAALPNLRTFILANTGLNQIGPLAGFSSLRVLNLANNQLVTVAPLKGLTTLEELVLARNKLIELADLESLFNLKKLDISNNPLKALKFMVKLEALQCLIANECPNLRGDWRELLVTVKEEADPRHNGLLHLQLKGNEIAWLPYQKASRTHSSHDVQRNDSAFHTSFPALQSLQIGSNIVLNGTAENPIKLSALPHK